MRTLGRTGLSVSGIGIGGGNGISGDDIVYAYDKGVNFFFFSSDLHHFIYAPMASGIRTLCRKGSPHRDKVVLAAVCYVKQPDIAITALLDQFIELGIEYLDILMWGWIRNGSDSQVQELLGISDSIRGPDAFDACNIVETLCGPSETLLRLGAVRYIGMSFHDPHLAFRYADDPRLDVMMLRHNLAHRTAQRNLVDLQANRSKPGIIAFKSLRAESGPLHRFSQEAPRGLVIPSVADCYRYNLSQPGIDVCLTGPRNRQEIDVAVEAASRGAMSEGEREYLELYGDIHRAKRPIDDIVPFLRPDVVTL